jgi:HAE1 family hydrophobic/amphiphilic exporter-1
MRRFFALLLFLPAPLFAAEPASLPLSLEEATRRALAKNQDIAIERESLVQADEAVRGSKGAYDPLLGLDTGYRQHTDPVNSQFSGAPLGQLGPEMKSFSLSASLSQLLPTGGSVSVFSTVGRDTTNNQFTILSPAWGSSLGISLRQPLLQNFSIDSARHAIRLAIVNRDGEVARLKRAVTDTVAAVESTYWQLIAARRSVEVLVSSVELARQQLSETQIRVDAGVLAKTDIAQPSAELERRRGNLVEARELFSRIANALRLLMYTDPSDPDWERDITPADEPTTPPINVDVQGAIATALKNRPEVFETAAVVARSGIEIEARESDVLPRLDLVASYARRGLGGSLNPDAISFTPGVPVIVPDALNGGLGRSLGTIGEGRFPDASVGLSLTFPILNRTARANLAVAKSQQRQARLSAAQIEQHIVAQVRDAAFALETARQRLEAARAGRAAAETQLYAEQERFGVGLSTNFFVLTRQNELTNARVAEISAQTDYRRAATELARATGTLLQQREITLSDSGGSPR